MFEQLPEQVLQHIQSVEHARDIVQRQRRRLLAWLAISVALLVMVAGGAALWLYYLMQREAEHSRHQATVERDVEETLHKAGALRTQERWKEAEAAVEKAEALLRDQGPEQLRQRVEQLRDDLDLIQRLDEIRLRKTDDLNEKANQAFQQRLDPVAQPSEEVSKAVRHGDTMLARQRFAEAITAFRQAIHLQPENVDAHYGLAVALHKQGKLDEAVTEYRETLRLDPKRTEALDNLGRLLKSDKPK
jgi:tetratricopeptide (TPR) repeat protein